MAADKENNLSIEDEKKYKRLREEEVKDVKEVKKVKTGEEEQEQEQQGSKEERLDQEGKQKKGAERDDKEDDDKKDDDKKDDDKKEKRRDSEEKNSKESSVSSVNKGQDDEPFRNTLQEDKPKDKPKFVFGANANFRSGFKISSNRSGDADEDQKVKKESSKEVGTPRPSAFGSGLSFGGGFGVLKKKEDKETDNNGKSSESSFDVSEKSRELSSPGANGIKLQKQEVKSGEESEETIYQANAKLYQLADIKAGWKERGIGIIKVNKNVNTGKSRLVMRSRGMLKVILNLPLIKGFTVQKGFAGSMQSEKFIRMVTQTDNKSPIQTAVKTGGKEIAQELHDSIVKLIPK